MCVPDNKKDSPPAPSIHNIPVTPLVIQQRAPSDSEKEFFNKSKIPGYAAEDNRIVMNPNDLPGVNKNAVKQNEALRIYVRKTKPDLPDLTDEQKKKIASNPIYSKADPYDQKATILGRIASGDPSGGKPSKEQEDFVKKAVKKFRIED